MKRIILPLLLLSVFACTEKVYLHRDVISFSVTFATEPACGTSFANRCAFSLAEDAFTVRLRVEALNEFRQVATGFNHSIIISTTPGGMFIPGGPGVKLLPDNRRVLIVTMNQGVWEGDVTFRCAFGEARILAEDMGYEPSPNAATAACANIYPSRGCFAPDDDNPNPGSGAIGASDALHFFNPRLRDIQHPWDESLITNNSRDRDASPLEGFRVTVDGDPFTGNPDCAPDERRLVVTAISLNGFNVTDVCSPGYPDYAHMYVYNFNTPEDLSRGDCLVWLQGAVAEFQGFTELKNPLWEVDRCKPGDGFCTVGQPKCVSQVPDPITITPDMLGSLVGMERIESALVEVTDVVSSHEFRVCDANGDGVIDYNIPQERTCKFNCGDEVGCVVKEDYDIYFTWTVDTGGREVGVVTKGLVPFDPEAAENLGRPIHKVRGLLKHLNFGAPAWIILPRDARDVCLTADNCD